MIGVSSILRLTRKDTVLVRVLPTLSLSPGKEHHTTVGKLPDVLAIADIKEIELGGFLL